MKCSFKRCAGIIMAVIVVLAVFITVGLHGKYTVPVMMYHNVQDSQEFRPNSVSPQNFDWQMAYLRDHGYHVISFEELVRHINYGDPIPPKAVVITFDDGYADNYTNAYEILKKYGYPAIIFLPSDLVGLDGHLSWEQVHEMTQHNITFGSHTLSHAYLPDLTESQQGKEIFESKKVIEQRLGGPVNYFAYPIGGFSSQIKQMVKNAGYVAAAATNRGYDRLNKDVYEINRIRFGDRDVRRDYMWIKLSGYYNLFRKAKEPN